MINLAGRRVISFEFLATVRRDEPALRRSIVRMKHGVIIFSPIRSPVVSLLRAMEILQ